MDRQLAQTAKLPTTNYLLLIRSRYRRNILQLFNMHLHRCCIIRRNLDVPNSLHFHRATTVPTHKQLAACRSCERRPSLFLHITANESDSWTTAVIIRYDAGTSACNSHYDVCFSAYILNELLWYVFGLPQGTTAFLKNCFPIYLVHFTPATTSTKSFQETNGKPASRNARGNGSV